MAGPQHRIGDTVNFARRDKEPSERKYTVVAWEKGRDGYVYHLATFDFDASAFRTQSHVPEDRLEKTPSSKP